jgi:hypothetical protein
LSFPSPASFSTRSEDRRGATFNPLEFNIGGTGECALSRYAQQLRDGLACQEKRGMLCLKSYDLGSDKFLFSERPVENSSVQIKYFL